MALDPRPEFHRVAIRPRGPDLLAISTGGQRSSRTVSLAGANGLICLPASEHGGKVKAGDRADAILIGPISSTG